MPSRTQISLYGWIASFATATIGAIGIFNRSLLLITVFLWIVTAVFWITVILLVALGIFRLRADRARERLEKRMLD